MPRLRQFHFNRDRTQVSSTHSLLRLRTRGSPRLSYFSALGHGMFMPCSFEGEPHFYSRSAAGRRIYSQLAAELRCPISNILHAVTASPIGARNIRMGGNYESSSIIAD